MAVGRGWGGASRAGSNHPVLACASGAPPYPREGSFVSHLCRCVINALMEHGLKKTRNPIMSRFTFLRIVGFALLGNLLILNFFLGQERRNQIPAGVVQYK